MPTIPLTTQDPGVFGYIEGQTFYNEQLAHEILKHAAAMAAEGYEISFQLPDTHDYNSLYSRQTITISSLVNALNAKTDREELIPYYQTYETRQKATQKITFHSPGNRGVSLCFGNISIIRKHSEKDNGKYQKFRNGKIAQRDSNHYHQSETSAQPNRTT